MMPVPWLFRMVESSACPPPLPCLSGLAEGRAWSLQWAAICPKPLSSKPVVRACDEDLEIYINEYFALRSSGTAAIIKRR